MDKSEIGPRAAEVLDFMRNHRDRENKAIAARLASRGIAVTNEAIELERQNMIRQREGWRDEGLPTEIDVPRGFGQNKP